MRGIRFRVPTEYNKYLWIIFQRIDIDSYVWYVSQDEILYFDIETQKVRGDLLKQRVYLGSELKKELTSTDYLINLANIQAYPIGSSKEDVCFYSDFLSSKCELVFLCADCNYIDIYCKNLDFINIIYNICLENHFSDIEYITDENDTRTRLML